MRARRAEGLAYQELTQQIIAAFYETYDELGPGFPESIYARAMERELMRRGLKVAREVNVRVYYKGEPIGWVRIDMLVEDQIVVELKAQMLPPAGSRDQLKGYLTATRLQVGLLFHYGLKPRFERLFVPRAEHEKRARLSPRP